MSDPIVSQTDTSAEISAPLTSDTSEIVSTSVPPAVVDSSVAGASVDTAAASPAASAEEVPAAEPTPVENSTPDATPAGPLDASTFSAPQNEDPTVSTVIADAPEVATPSDPVLEVPTLTEDSTLTVEEFIDNASLWLETAPTASSASTDANGNPAGGYEIGTGFFINWQNGPLVVDGERKEPNGAFVETVLKAALNRLYTYQLSKFACRENALAITKIEEALHWLDARTKDREARGVEGSHEL